MHCGKGLEERIYRINFRPEVGGYVNDGTKLPTCRRCLAGELARERSETDRKEILLSGCVFGRKTLALRRFGGGFAPLLGNDFLEIAQRFG